ncbi:Integral membrane protein [Tsukamurella ocularis]
MYGTDVDARARGEFPSWLLGGRAQLTAGLRSLVDDWFGFHLIKAVSAGLLVALALYVGHRALALIPTVLLIANVQGAVAPLSSAFSLLDPARLWDGEPGRALALMRAELRGTPSGPVHALVDDFARYHLAVVVMAGVLTVILVVFAVRAWRQDRPRWAIATVVAAVAAGVVTAANVTTTLDPIRGLLDFLGS